MTHAASNKLVVSGELPVLAANTAELLTILTDRDSDMGDVANSIENHATIVAKIVSLANSSWSMPVTPVSALDQACSRLGLDIVRTLSIALTVGRSFSVSRCENFNPVHFWMSSIVTANLASSLAEEQGLDVGAARTAGLVHNVGLLWLADGLAEDTNAALLTASHQPDRSLDKLLDSHCGIGYREASRQLLTHWNMPEELIPYCEDSPNMCFSPMNGLVEMAADLSALILANDDLDAVDFDRYEANPDFVRKMCEIQRSQLDKFEGLASAIVG